MFDARYALSCVSVVLKGYAIATTALVVVEETIGAVALYVDVFLVPVRVHFGRALKHVAADILLLFVGHFFVLLKRVAPTVSRDANAFACTTIAVVVFAVKLATFQIHNNTP